MVQQAGVDFSQLCADAGAPLGSPECSQIISNAATSSGLSTVGGPVAQATPVVPERPGDYVNRGEVPARPAAPTVVPWGQGTTQTGDGIFFNTVGGAGDPAGQAASGAGNTGGSWVDRLGGADPGVAAAQRQGNRGSDRPVAAGGSYTGPQLPPPESVSPTPPALTDTGGSGGLGATIPVVGMGGSSNATTATIPNLQPTMPAPGQGQPGSIGGGLPGTPSAPFIPGTTAVGTGAGNTGGMSIGSPQTDPVAQPTPNPTDQGNGAPYNPYNITGGAAGNAQDANYAMGGRDFLTGGNPGNWMAGSDVTLESALLMDPQTNPLGYGYAMGEGLGVENPMQYAVRNQGLVGEAPGMYGLMNPGQTLQNTPQESNFVQDYTGMMNTPISELEGGVLDVNSMYDNMFSPEATPQFGEPGAVAATDQIAAVRGNLQLIAPYVPSGTINAVNGMLAQAEVMWQQEVAEGSTETFIQFLDKIGAQDWL